MRVDFSDWGKSPRQARGSGAGDNEQEDAPGMPGIPIWLERRNSVSTMDGPRLLEFSREWVGKALAVAVNQNEPAFNYQAAMNVIASMGIAVALLLRASSKGERPTDAYIASWQADARKALNIARVMLEASRAWAEANGFRAGLDAGVAQVAGLEGVVGGIAQAIAKGFEALKTLVADTLREAKPWLIGAGALGLLALVGLLFLRR